jgi:2-amino-4-hydroxy-6-hydroxymethyldihydropteridine diphosphokinase
MSESFIGLGANLGEPAAQIRSALELLRQNSVVIESASSLYRTQPVDAPPEPWFINGVIRARSAHSALGLLRTCQSIEQTLGRERRERHGPRTIDLDLLLVGDVILDGPELTLPHPELHRRRFVLIPLAEIAPGWRHPRLGLTVRELLDRCPDGLAVERILPPPL